jgi:hypothetical protein
MEIKTTARQMGKTATLGGVLAGALLLPLPVFAYTISNWTFLNNGVNATNPNGDNTTIQYFIPAGGFNSNASNTGTATITGSNETANVFLNLAGLHIFTGDLRITVTIGGQTHTLVFGPGDVGSNIFLGAFMVNGTMPVSVNFQFENSTFSYNSHASTSASLVFR